MKRSLLECIKGFALHCSRMENDNENSKCCNAKKLKWRKGGLQFTEKGKLIESQKNRK